MFKLLFISISGLLWGKWYSQQQDSRVWGEGGSQPHRGPLWNPPRSDRRGLCPWEWAGSVHREQNPLQQLRWSVDHVQQWSYHKVFVMMNEAWLTFHINLIVHVWKCKQKIDLCCDWRKAVYTLLIWPIYQSFYFSKSLVLIPKQTKTFGMLDCIVQLVISMFLL